MNEDGWDTDTELDVLPVDELMRELFGQDVVITDDREGGEA